MRLFLLVIACLIVSACNHHPQPMALDNLQTPLQYTATETQAITCFQPAFADVHFPKWEEWTKQGNEQEPHARVESDSLFAKQFANRYRHTLLNGSGKKQGTVHLKTVQRLRTLSQAYVQVSVFNAQNGVVEAQNATAFWTPQATEFGDRRAREQALRQAFFSALARFTSQPVNKECRKAFQ